MIFLGFDPGKHGAVAGLGERGSVWVSPIPVRRVRTSLQYDPRGLIVLLRKAIGLTEEWGTRGDVFATVELPQAMPPHLGGFKANFARGYACAMIETALVGLGIPSRLVNPKEWQKAMHPSGKHEDRKAVSIAQARYLFPGVGLRREGSKLLDDGMAEALLIAQYGRRMHPIWSQSEEER